MKKLISVLLIVVMLLSLAACKSAKQDQAANGTAAPTEAVKETEVPATEEPEATEPEETLPPTEPDPTPAPVTVEAKQPKVIFDSQRYYIVDKGEQPDTWGTVYYIDAEGELWAQGDNRMHQISADPDETVCGPYHIMSGVADIYAHRGRAFALKADGTLLTWGVAAPWQNAEAYGFDEPTEVLRRVVSTDGYFALTAEGELWNVEHGSDGTVVPVKVADGVAQYKRGSYFGVYVINSKDELRYYQSSGSEPVWSGMPVASSAAKPVFDDELYIGTDGALYEVQYSMGYPSGSEELIENVTDVVYGSFSWFYAITEEGSLWGYGPQQGFLEECRMAPAKMMEDVRQVVANCDINEDYYYDYSFAVKNDNTLWAWGSNRFGELGCGRGVSAEKPVCVAEDVRTVYCDGYSTYIIKTDGSLWAVGYNGPENSAVTYALGMHGYESRLGDGTSECRYEFVKIADGVASVCQCLDCVEVNDPSVDDGMGSWDYCYLSRTFIIKTDGSLWGWGYNGDLAIDASDETYVTVPDIIVEAK